MENGSNRHVSGVGRARRVVACLLSLVAPGAGHFLLGSFRRGTAWALGLTVLGFALLFTIPIGIASLLIVAAIALLGQVAAAVDAVRLTATRPSWMMVGVAWAALLVFGWALDGALRGYYKTHYAQAFTIPSGSMMDTLLIGDYVLSDNAVYRARDPRRGDIVVFKYPKDERRTFIFRIVAVGGDRVQVRDNRVFINGALVDEPYVKTGSFPGARSGHCGYLYACEPTLVPAGSYFVIGDNRDNSQDSRYWGLPPARQDHRPGVRHLLVVGLRDALGPIWSRRSFSLNTKNRSLLRKHAPICSL